VIEMKTDREIYPIYFIYGTEELLIEEEIRKLLDRALGPKERGLNIHTFNGGEHTPQEIVEAAQTLPMFARYRFILVREAEKIDPDDLEIFRRYLGNPSPSTCLVLRAQSVGPWKGLLPGIEKVGKVAEHSRLKGKALVSWVRSRMAEKGKTISEEAADYLLEVVGDNLYHLENALEKAFLSAGTRGTIELGDLEGTVADVKVSTVYELTEAIGHQDVAKALGVLEQVMSSKAVSFRREEGPSKMDDPVPILLSMMARQYRMIWKVKETLSGHPEVAEAARVLKMSPWVMRKLVDQSKKFSESSLRSGILKCHKTDLAIKKGRGPKELLMEKLVIDLCHPQER
jgi:DNA polymerase-3 subunit delta